MSKIYKIEDMPADDKKTADMLNRNWNQILKAALLQMGISAIELSYGDLEKHADDPRHLSINVSASGFKIHLMTDAETEQMSLLPDVTVAETTAEYALDKPHLNS